MMQIVIDIDDDLYEHTQKYEVGVFNQENDMKLFMAIRKGTPLPKGHGRLVDEKDLSLMTVHMIDGMFVCDAPTIIEGVSVNDSSRFA